MGNDGDTRSARPLDTTWSRWTRQQRHLNDAVALTIPGPDRAAPRRAFRTQPLTGDETVQLSELLAQATKNSNRIHLPPAWLRGPGEYVAVAVTHPLLPEAWVVASRGVVATYESRDEVRRDRAACDVRADDDRRIECYALALIGSEEDSGLIEDLTPARARRRTPSQRTARRAVTRLLGI